MKPLFTFKFIFIAFLTLNICYSQGFQEIVTEDIDDLCNGHQSQAADLEAEMVVDQMMAQMQLKRIFKIRKCSKIQNAFATMQKDENENLAPYILYDPTWLKSMADNSDTDWASIGVLAHEVGHFLLFHTLNKKGSNPRWEIDADRFAGKTMAMMGSTLEEAQSMFANYTLKEDSRTHPARNKRLEAVKTGWMNVNNPTKNIILNENTPERDVNPELIFNRYFKEMGGLKNMGQVKQINFKENISEKIGDRKGQKPLDYNYSYELSSNRTRIVYQDQNEEYLIINNDSLSHKFLDEEKWSTGAPRIGTSLDNDPYDFKRSIRPSIYYYFDDFSLISNPEIADYRRRKTIEDEECFIIELPQETQEIGDLLKKGKRIVLTKRYYYSTYTGLLHAIEEIEKISFFRRAQIKDSETRKTNIVISTYQEIEDIIIPSIINKKITLLENDIPKDDETIYQERTLSDIELIKTSNSESTNK
ncbi:hypothetical protein [Maribacter sp. Asnod2-G09]|uniref:hypothetical protein n=1 Tax=Maribacter sp. Asnod2-G09 TaxID=3160577 RepID=UPI00386F9F60